MGILTQRVGSSRRDIGIKARSRCPLDCQERLVLTMSRMLSRQILHIFNIVFGEAVPPRTCIAFGTRVYVIICTWLSTLPDLLELSSNCAVCAHDLSTGIVTILRTNVCQAGISRKTNPGTRTCASTGSRCFSLGWPAQCHCWRGQTCALPALKLQMSGNVVQRTPRHMRTWTKYKFPVAVRLMGKQKG